jgi:hypothetical protein
VCLSELCNWLRGPRAFVRGRGGSWKRAYGWREACEHLCPPEHPCPHPGEEVSDEEELVRPLAWEREEKCLHPSESATALDHQKRGVQDQEES